MAVDLILTVLALGILLQFVDATLGMGFGLLTPILLLLGFPLLQAVTAVLFASAALSLLTGAAHHAVHTIDITSPGTRRVLTILLGFGIMGMLLGVGIADTVSPSTLRVYIGLITVGVGLLILLYRRTAPTLSWQRLMAFGGLAAFNKGMTGGGFGPVLAGGQIVSGVDSREAVGVTALTEGVLSVVGVAAYLAIDPTLALHWPLITSLLLGGVLATPLAAYAVKRADPSWLNVFIAMGSILIGLTVILQSTV